MALRYDEYMENGFVKNAATGQVVLTFDSKNATVSNGFLRDPDGRLVIRNAK